MPAVEGAAYSYDGSNLYVYGGRNANGEPLAGLYEIDLSSLTGYRVDSGSGPGARAEAALRYDPVSRTVHLFGGADSAAKRDLWRFHLGARSWQRVSTEGAPAMVKGAVVPGRRDGAINVLAGKMARGSTLPLWRYRAGAWKNYYQVMNP